MTRNLEIHSIVCRRLAEMIPPLFLSSLVLGTSAIAGRPSRLTDLRRIAGSEGLDEAAEYLADLPDQPRRELARAAATDADLGVSAIGINSLVQSGRLDEAVPALSARVAGGDDLKAFGYAWVHGDDPQLPVRMYLKICRYQLARLGSFDGTQRLMVERFLSDGGYFDPLREFSPEAVERRLMRIEAGLRGSSADGD